MPKNMLYGEAIRICAFESTNKIINAVSILARWTYPFLWNNESLFKNPIPILISRRSTVNANKNIFETTNVHAELADK